MCIISTETCYIINILIGICVLSSNALLLPQQSESRLIQDLCGLWQFRIDNSISRNEGFQNQWWNNSLYKSGPVEIMPVPSSYNDISVMSEVRDHIGWAWYDTEFYVHRSWKESTILLRFDSVHYNAIVWINGKAALKHSGGHLPFETIANSYLTFDGPNRLTVAVNNTLTPFTLPPGEIVHGDSRYPKGYFTQKIYFDFFNYAGIHRKVQLLSIPKSSIRDITITTESINYKENTAIIDVTTEVDGYFSTIDYNITDADGVEHGYILLNRDFSNQQPFKAVLLIRKPRLWYPVSMATKDVAHRYTIKIIAKGKDGRFDVYYQKFGIRMIRITDSQFLINQHPFYCHGLSKHEDSDLRGKGLDAVILARDLQLMIWMGVNCVRTSHYPYAEEFLELTDRYGIAVIGEAPAVGLRKESFFSNKTLHHHMIVMKEMIDRDKNHPSVIMWSVANEPSSNLPIADYYFKTIIEFTKSIDSRPVTFVVNQWNDIAGKYVDVFCFNRYYGWYQDIGHTSVISHRLSAEIEKWYARYRKPIIVTEYGADTIAGQHMLPSQAFTEEYQCQLIHEYHHVFDKYRKLYLVGELYWNFADFMTAQDVKRVVGNKKGLFTRQRQPKMSAYVMRKRYLKLINETTTLQ